jgi:hypothetical protein
VNRDRRRAADPNPLPAVFARIAAEIAADLEHTS